MEWNNPVDGCCYCFRRFLFWLSKEMSEHRHTIENRRETRKKLYCKAINIGMTWKKATHRTNEAKIE